MTEELLALHKRDCPAWIIPQLEVVVRQSLYEREANGTADTEDTHVSDEDIGKQAIYDSAWFRAAKFHLQPSFTEVIRRMKEYHHGRCVKDQEEAASTGHEIGAWLTDSETESTQ